MTTIRSKRWGKLRRLWWRVFGHPLRGFYLVRNGQVVGRIKKVEGDIITYGCD